MTDLDGRPHIDRQIEAEAGELAAGAGHGYAKPIGAALAAEEDASAQLEDANREVAKRKTNEVELRQKAEALGERHGPNRIVVLGTKLLLFLISLPIDVQATHAFAMPPTLQAILAITIGAGMVVAADGAARKIEDLHQAHMKRDTDSFNYAKERWLLGLAIGAPVLVIVGTTLMRSQAFATEARLTGGIVQGGAANIAFGALALLAFSVALLMALAHRRALPLRQLKAELARNKAEREHWQKMADEAERLQRGAGVTIAWLEERREKRIEKIHRWGEHRKAAVGHLAAAVEARARRAQGRRRSGVESERADTTAPVASRSMAAPPDSTRLQPVDLVAMADEVRVRANRHA